MFNPLPNWYVSYLFTLAAISLCNTQCCAFPVRLDGHLAVAWMDANIVLYPRPESLSTTSTVGGNVY